MYRKIIKKYSILENEAICLNHGFWKVYNNSLIKINWKRNTSFLKKRIGSYRNLELIFYFKKNDKCKRLVDFVTQTPKGSLAISFADKFVYYNLEAQFNHAVFEKKLNVFSKKMNTAKIEYLPDLDIYISPYYEGTLFQKLSTKRDKEKALLKFIDSVLSCTSFLDEVKMQSYKDSYKLAFLIVKRNNFFKIELSKKNIINIKNLLNSSKLIEGHGDLSVNNVIFFPDNDYVAIDWFDAFQIIPDWFDATHILCTKGIELLFDSLFFSNVINSLSKELDLKEVTPMDLFIAWRIAWATNRSTISGSLDLSLFEKNVQFSLGEGIKKLKDNNICIT